MMKQAQLLNIELADLTIRGFRSAPNNVSGETPRVICIHGWLDNANSFAPVYPLLTHCDIVAIDLPGHGRSDHYRNHVPYTVASSMHYVLQVATALGWDSFHLLGHSLGGCIAPLCAVAESDRIESLMLIDALGPISEPESDLPDRLVRFHREMLLPPNQRVFKTIEDAVAVRMKAVTMTEPVARLIVERQLKNTQHGLQWSFDAKLKSASPSYFTEAQVQSILSAIDCPVLCVIAETGYLIKHRHLQQRAACVKNLTQVTVPGNHHLHMDTPAPVATQINQFLDKL
jgi:pimeloyl-ACP methyl ester carboxylesterase